MNKPFYIQALLIFCFFTGACDTDKNSESQMTEKLEYDSTVSNDSILTSIIRLDGSQITTAVLEEKIDALIQAAEVTGLALAILNGNQVVFRKAFGYANHEKKTPLQISHSFYGASFSKAVFGYLCSILVNEGVLDLDKPLQQYLDFPLYKVNAESEKEWRHFDDLKNDPRYKKITARMCLTHSTGFQNWRWIPRPGETDNTEKLKIYFDPGTDYFYSGEGISLLQYVIEHITGRGLEELAREKIFEPFQMKNTSYLWQERFEGTYCHGHTAQQQIIAKKRRDEAGAAGSMETNLIDYSIFLKHILTQYKEESEIVKLMLKPNFRIRSKAQFGPLSLEKSDENDDIQLSYGLGWGLLQSPYGPGAFKEGHDEGFQHYSIIFPEKEMGVVILSNSDNAESIFKELLENTIADIYTPWKWEHYIPYQMRGE